MATTPVAAPPRPSVARSGKRARAVLGVWGLILALVAVTALEARHVFLGRNAHAVLPGHVYRCAQPSAADLKREIVEHGIRTVVNLRGCSFPLSWYLEESRATQALDVAQEDICFSAGRLPSPTELRRFVEVLDRRAVKADALLTHIEGGKPSHFESHCDGADPALFGHRRRETAQ